jgi:LacI family transcriptional regulator
VSEATIAKVRAAMEKLGYQPNLYARSLSLGRQYRFAVLLPKAEQDCGYWGMTVAGIDRAAAELKAYGVTVDIFYHDRGSARSFASQVKRIAGANVDGILCAPISTANATERLERECGGIPRVLFDSDIPEYERLAYIGQDAYGSGRICARLMNQLVPAGSRIEMIRPEVDDHHIAERIRGFTELCGEVGNGFRCTVHALPSTADRRSYRALLKLLMVAEGDAAGGFFIADASAYQVAEFFAESCAPGTRPAVIGHDLVEPNRKWVGAGMIDFLVNQKPARQTYEGLHLLHRQVALGQAPEQDRLLMPLEIIMQDNVACCEL